MKDRKGLQGGIPLRFNRNSEARTYCCMPLVRVRLLVEEEPGIYLLNDLS
ncbi:MAG TPA: hypothetical protein VMW57_07915 [Methyloceanibacter sp.]|nr:hypothetical protein [Methyloceanibacter sp.]